jgi:hypothetical protein
VRTLVGLLLTVWTTGGAFAAGAPKLPEVDIEAECSTVGKADPTARLTCVELEKRGYDNLQEVWPSTPEDIKAACLLSKRYTAINECVDKATAARAASD